MPQEVIPFSNAQFVDLLRRSAAEYAGAEWSATDLQSDEEHLNDYRNGLCESRTRLALDPETNLHFIQSGAGTLALIGHTPSAPARAALITSLLSNLDRIAADMEYAEHARVRIVELLESNNEKLMEARALRAELKLMAAREKWLLQCITDALAKPEDAKA